MKSWSSRKRSANESAVSSFGSVLHHFETRGGRGISRGPRGVWVVVWLACFGFQAACGGSRDPADAAELSAPVDEIRARLLGEWSLVEFRLEDGQGDLLTGVFGPDLSILFREDTVVVRGAARDVEVQYSLTNPVPNGATLHVHLEGGISYEIVGRFEENLVRFRSVTEPWRGAGALARR